MSRPRLSVVVPVYNAADTLCALYRQLCAALDGMDVQLIFVDDASRDDSRKILSALALRDHRITALFLTRNRGQQEATLCGIQRASGVYIATMDDDGQHPPALLPPMLQKLEREKLDIVYAIPANAPRRLGGRMRDRLFVRLYPANPVRVSAFRVMTRALGKKVVARRGRFNYFSATALQTGASAGHMFYPCNTHRNSRSRYSYTARLALYGRILWYYGLCPRCREGTTRSYPIGELIEDGQITDSRGIQLPVQRVPTGERTGHRNGSV